MKYAISAASVSERIALTILELASSWIAAIASAISTRIAIFRVAVTYDKCRAGAGARSRRRRLRLRAGLELSVGQLDARLAAVVPGLALGSLVAGRPCGRVCELLSSWANAASACSMAFAASPAGARGSARARGLRACFALRCDSRPRGRRGCRGSASCPSRSRSARTRRYSGQPPL